MRRKDRELTKEETLGVLRRGTHGTLAMVTADGAPYAVPLSYALDEAGARLYFHATAAGGAKKDALLAHPVASFVVVTGTKPLPEKFSTVYWSAIAQGPMRLVADEDAIKAALLLLVKKYSPDYLAKGQKYIEDAWHLVDIWEMAIEELTGKARKK